MTELYAYFRPDGIATCPGCNNELDFFTYVAEVRAQRWRQQSANDWQFMEWASPNYPNARCALIFVCARCGLPMGQAPAHIVVQALER